VKRTLLEILACPRCHAALSSTPAVNAADDLLEGVLRCTGCGVEYPIRNGIPRFVPADNYAASFGMQWNLFREEQLDSASGAGLSSARFFDETGWTADWLRGRRVLDAGCGAGRFLEVAASTGAEVVGLDISSAVDAARATVARFPNAHVVQASLYEPPFRDGVFDAAYCIGVLQHTPEPPRALAPIPRVLKPGAPAVVVAYERKPWTLLNAKYLVRPVTRRMTKTALLRAITWSMPVLFAATEVLFRIPLAGRVFKFIIPVANYTHERRLSLRQRYQWAILDTFDMLSPAYDQPQTEAEVVGALQRAGLADVHRRDVPGGLTVMGSKPADGASGPRR
jgi:SAM-dependent methyltransferase